jgi:uncharacterized membrane protein SirB2
MARPIPYEHDLTEWASAGSGRRVLRGLIIGLMLSVVISVGVWILSTNVDSKIFGDTSVVARICRYLYDSRVGSGIRESVWVFPIVEGTHLLGIALSVGMLCWFDLRLLGLVLRDEPVSKVWKQVMPVAFVGFALMFVTGVLLFWAEAFTAFHSVHFWIKMLLLVLAGVNALRFETTAHRNMAEWDLAPVPPLNARMTGAISLILWTAIIITGRTMAYNF